MTLLKQFEASVTGSDLSNHFRTTRIRLTIFCFIILSILLLFVGYSTFETSRRGFDKIPSPIEIESGRGIREKITNYNMQVRIQNLEHLQRSIIINHFFLIVLLTAIAWISLYYLLKPLSDTYKEKEKFLKYITHELRTPLAILKSDLQLSLQENDISEIKKTNKSSLEEIDRLHLLASGFLSQLSGEKASKPISNIDIAVLVSDIWSSLESINENRLKLEIKGSPYITKVNKNDIFHLLFNILDNCIKYSKSETVVEIIFEQVNNKIIVKNQTEASQYTEGVGLEIIQKSANDLGAEMSVNLDKDIFKLIIKGIV
ncbi:MAG: HAMP domain-containing histidine kinase [candidate division SR1 bacterium]|nr:HAMP domain-containing histidine kinase [candidate division SR1 bacterium]